MPHANVPATLRRLGAFLVAASIGAPAMACTPEDLTAVPWGYNIDYETQIQPIFGQSCDGCHIGGAAGGLALDPGSSFGNLINVPATNAAAMRPRIAPGNVNASFLFRKINCENLDSALGLRMPRNGPPYLSAQQQATIMDWINEGAFPLADPDLVFGSGFESRVNATPF